MPSKERDDFVWRLIVTGMLPHKSKDVENLISVFYEQEIEISAVEEELIIKFCESDNRPLLVNLCCNLLTSRLNFSSFQRMCLVAYLYSQKDIKINKAFDFLNYLNSGESFKIEALQNLMNVLWAIEQDAEINFMKPDEDSLLSDALNRVSNEIGLSYHLSGS